MEKCVSAADEAKQEELKIKRKLARAVIYCLDHPEQASEWYEKKDSVMWTFFSLRSKQGKLIYQTFTDGEILSVLKRAAQVLDHSPSQKEILWVFREYVKMRFKKWPYALEQAGLSRGAGRGGRSLKEGEKERQKKKQVLNLLKEKALELGYIPHPHQCSQLARELSKYYTSWGKAIQAAGVLDLQHTERAVSVIVDLEPEYWELLHRVSSLAWKLGRAPMHHEVKPEWKEVLIKRCGSWRNVLYQIGLEPVVRMHPFEGCYLDYRKDSYQKEGHSKNLQNCYYRILHPDPQICRDLEELKKRVEKSGKMPNKNQVSEDVRRRLLAVCGSWNNVWYQLGHK